MSDIASWKTIEHASIMNGVRVETKPAVVWSDGARMDADLFRPAGLSPDQKLPGLVFVHGWGGSKENMNAIYTPHFASLGFVVLVINCRGWGKSEGKIATLGKIPQRGDPQRHDNDEVTLRVKELRELVDPIDQFHDTNAALDFLAGEEHVDAQRLGLFGTSLSGAVTLAAASRDARVKALYIQIGAINTAANVPLPEDVIADIKTKRARGESPHYPGEENKSPLFKGIPDYLNFATFDPIAMASDLAIPTLIFDAEDEELFDPAQNGKLLHERLKANGAQTQYSVLPGKHYDFYSGENLEVARKAAGDWFIKYLQ